jgi:hypothetical protein
VELQGRVAQLKRTGLWLSAISYDWSSVLSDFPRRRCIPFPLLSDAGSVVIEQYRLLNTSVPENSSTYGIPFPGTFLLDARGLVTDRFFESAYQERDTVSSILVKLGRGATGRGTKVAAPHLDVTAYSSDPTVAPGTHFSLILDIAPGPHVHVYAPGVSGYKPVALRLDVRPPLLVRTAQFPKPDDYFFKPLNEHMEVYQRTLRILQASSCSPSQQAA